MKITNRILKAIEEAKVDKKFFTSIHKRLLNKFPVLKKYYELDGITDHGLMYMDTETGEILGISTNKEKTEYSANMPSWQMDDFVKEIMKTKGLSSTSDKSDRPMRTSPKVKQRTKVKDRRRPKQVEKEYKRFVKDYADGVAQSAKEFHKINGTQGDLRDALEGVVADATYGAFDFEPIVTEYLIDLKGFKKNVAQDVFTDDVYEEALKILKLR